MQPAALEADRKRQHDGDQRSDKRERLAEPGDARPFAIIAGELGSPRGVGKLRGGKTHRKQRTPECEVESAGFRGGPEQHHARDGSDRQGHQEEAAATAKGRAPAVGKPADGRIGHRVHDPHDQQSRADRAERQAQRLGIESRNDDVERQRHRCDRDRRKRIEQQLRERHSGNAPGGFQGHLRGEPDSVG